MPDEIRHRKNAAEWIMWIALLPVYWIALLMQKRNDQ
jgi:hypothetical protein